MAGSRLALGALLTTLSLSSLGCGPSYVRGTEVGGLDDPAMSTGLDKRDLQKAMHEAMSAFLGSKIGMKWQAAQEGPQVAIYPIANETSEHIESALDALLSDMETFLVENELGTVISAERRDSMMAEIAQQYGGGFDPRARTEVNKQLGVEYFLTGKVYTSDERTSDSRRVQYYLFIQCIEVSTSAIKFQKKVEITKALVD